MRPQDHLESLAHQFPNAWSLVNKFRNINYFKKEWPSWCFLPLRAWQGIVAQEYKTSTLNLEQIRQVSHLAAIGTWRYTQGIYRFDTDLYKMLIQRSIIEKVDESKFYFLPEWAVYIETPALYWSNRLLLGFWFHLGWDYQKKYNELCFLLNSDKFVSISLPLNKWTTNELFQNVYPNLYQNNSNTNTLIVMTYLAYYICNSPIPISNDFGNKPSLPLRKIYKNKFRLFPPNTTNIWNVIRKST
ncbi:hypothetical protein [Legionella sainthelensi]|uniref:Uncharacterized protein n=1 Tax=Legionella sainthelensi TaxID=28087 RepID=A0A2H5FRR8_9GAMM|nr:hypothetical protein [Legionella sainthelensi]AUH74203.1 hypothetical protein CAB17_19855 [Legionella sainthelensi]